MMKVLLALSFLGILNTPSKGFKKLLCDYNLEELSINLSKKELIKGFTKIDKIDCLRELKPSSFWFTIMRNGNQSETKIIKYENRAEIPKFLKGIKKGDLITFTLIINQHYLERRDKTIQVI